MVFWMPFGFLKGEGTMVRVVTSKNSPEKNGKKKGPILEDSALVFSGGGNRIRTGE